jgi:hypothetical protein
MGVCGAAGSDDTATMKPVRLAAVAASGLLLAVAILGASAAPAATGLPLLSGCNGQTYSQPFLPWLDPGFYTLVSDGGFEAAGAGWTLSGASVTSGNEPWFVRGAQDSRSLYLPPGASATSPATCIGLLHPTTRFFVRGLGLGATLKVEATVRSLGQTLIVPVGVLLPGGSFAPTLTPLPILGNLTTLLSGGTGTVTLKFTALLGAVVVDDVLVDPFKVN